MFVRFNFGIGALLLAAFGSLFAKADTDPLITISFAGTGYIPSSLRLVTISDQFVEDAVFNLPAPIGQTINCPADSCFFQPPAAFPCLAGLSGIVADLDYIEGTCDPSPPTSGEWFFQKILLLAGVLG